MYKDMFVDRTPPPSEHDLALRDKSLIAAEAVLKQALLDEAETRDSAAKGTGAHTAEVDEEIDPINPNKRDGDTIDDSDMGTVGESDEDLEYVSESDEESDFDQASGSLLSVLPASRAPAKHQSKAWMQTSEMKLRRVCHLRRRGSVL
jgi:hypothetical protein